MGSEPLLYRKVTDKVIEFSLYKSHRVFGVSFEKQNREYAEAGTTVAITVSSKSLRLSVKIVCNYGY